MDKTDMAIRFMNVHLTIFGNTMSQEGRDTVDFIIQELTKIKNGEYVSKPELLSDEEIKNILFDNLSYTLEDPYHEPLKMAGDKATKQIENISKALSGKIPKANVDREKIIEILNTKMLLNPIFDDTIYIKLREVIPELTEAIITELNR